MKKVIILLFLGIILNGCSTFYNLQYKIYKRQKDNTILEVVEEKKDEKVVDAEFEEVKEENKKN